MFAHNLNHNRNHNPPKKITIKKFQDEKAYMGALIFFHGPQISISGE